VVLRTRIIAQLAIVGGAVFCLGGAASLGSTRASGSPPLKHSNLLAMLNKTWLSATPLAFVVVALTAQTPPAHLWVDATAATIGETNEWTNKVEAADINGDGRPDLLFANGGNYSDPGTPELSRVFVNRGPGQTFVERTAEVFGPTPGLARVIKARDFSGDGVTDIVVGMTHQMQTRLYLGSGGGAF